MPSVYYRDPQTLTLHGCTGLTGRVWRVVFSNGDPSMEGPLTETEPGVYVGEIPGFSSTGWARVVTTLLRDCADDETFDFTIYIDPSGIVTDQFGRPLPGMDVTLLKAGDDGNGVTAFLPVATVTRNYQVTLVASGGMAPYSWHLVDGALPDSLRFDETGVLTGVVDQSGPVEFTVGVTDVDGRVTDRAVRQHVDESWHCEVDPGPVLNGHSPSTGGMGDSRHVQQQVRRSAARSVNRHGVLKSGVRKNVSGGNPAAFHHHQRAG